MNRILIALGLGALAALVLPTGLLAGLSGQGSGSPGQLPGPGEDLPIQPDPGQPGSTLLPGGGDCLGGCAALPEPQSDLSAERFALLLADYAGAPFGAVTPALEELLFHGERSLELLADHAALAASAASQADAGRIQWLRTELSRRAVHVQLRVIDANGVIHASLDEARMPLDAKQHAHVNTRAGLQALELSMTLRRVGLAHLWARL